jgi:hypothetical protein
LRLIVAIGPDLFAKLRIANDDETPVLDIERRRRLDRGLEKFFHLLVAELVVGIEVFDGTAAVDRVEGVPALILICCCPVLTREL